MFFPRATALLFSAFALSLVPLATGQTATAAPTSAPAPVSGSATVPTPALASYIDLLKPSLDRLYATLADLKLDKWKGGSVRAEAEHDTASIVDDLNQKIP